MSFTKLTIESVSCLELHDNDSTVENALKLLQFLVFYNQQIHNVSAQRFALLNMHCTRIVTRFAEMYNAFSNWIIFESTLAPKSYSTNTEIDVSTNLTSAQNSHTESEHTFIHCLEKDNHQFDTLCEPPPLSELWSRLCNQLLRLCSHRGLTHDALLVAATVTCLRCVAREEITKGCFAMSDGFSIVFRQMQRHMACDSVHDAAITLLYNLCSVLHNKQSMMTSGTGLRLLLEIMDRHPQNSRVQSKACALLGRLAAGDESDVRIFAIHKKNFIPRILRSMSLFPLDANLQCDACLAIRNLAMSGQVEKQVVALGGTSQLFLAIFNHSDNALLLEEAVAALHNLACDEGSRLYLMNDRLFGLRMILRTMQLSPDNLAIQHRCLRLLRNLCNSAPAFLQRRMVVGCPDGFYVPLPEPPIESPAYILPPIFVHSAHQHRHHRHRHHHDEEVQQRYENGSAHEQEHAVDSTDNKDVDGIFHDISHSLSTTFNSALENVSETLGLGAAAEYVSMSVADVAAPAALVEEEHEDADFFGLQMPNDLSTLPSLLDVIIEQSLGDENFDANIDDALNGSHADSGVSDESEDISNSDASDGSESTVSNQPDEPTLDVVVSPGVTVAALDEESIVPVPRLSDYIRGMVSGSLGVELLAANAPCVDSVITDVSVTKPLESSSHSNKEHSTLSSSGFGGAEPAVSNEANNSVGLDVVQLTKRFRLAFTTQQQSKTRQSDFRGFCSNVPTILTSGPLSHISGKLLSRRGKSTKEDPLLDPVCISHLSVALPPDQPTAVVKFSMSRTPLAGSNATIFPAPDCFDQTPFCNRCGRRGSIGIADTPLSGPTAACVDCRIPHVYDTFKSPLVTTASVLSSSGNFLASSDFFYSPHTNAFLASGPPLLRPTLSRSRSETYNTHPRSAVAGLPTPLAPLVFPNGPNFAVLSSTPPPPPCTPHQTHRHQQAAKPLPLYDPAGIPQSSTSTQCAADALLQGPSSAATLFQTSRLNKTISGGVGRPSRLLSIPSASSTISADSDATVPNGSPRCFDEATILSASCATPPLTPQLIQTPLADTPTDSGFQSGLWPPVPSVLDLSTLRNVNSISVERLRLNQSTNEALLTSNDVALPAALFAPGAVLAPSMLMRTRTAPVSSFLWPFQAHQRLTEPAAIDFATQVVGLSHCDTSPDELPPASIPFGSSFKFQAETPADIEEPPDRLALTPQYPPQVHHAYKTHAHTPPLSSVDEHAPVGDATPPPLSLTAPKYSATSNATGNPANPPVPSQQRARTAFGHARSSSMASLPASVLPAPLDTCAGDGHYDAGLGALEVILAGMDRHPHSEEIQVESCWALSSLAQFPWNRPDMLLAGVLPRLLNLLTASTPIWRTSGDPCDDSASVEPVALFMAQSLPLRHNVLRALTSLSSNFPWSHVRWPSDPETGRSMSICKGSLCSSNVQSENMTALNSIPYKDHSNGLNSEQSSVDSLENMLYIAKRASRSALRHTLGVNAAQSSVSLNGTERDLLEIELEIYQLRHQIALQAFSTSSVAALSKTSGFYTRLNHHTGSRVPLVALQLALALPADLRCLWLDQRLSIAVNGTEGQKKKPRSPAVTDNSHGLLANVESNNFTWCALPRLSLLHVRAMPYLAAQCSLGDTWPSPLLEDPIQESYVQLLRLLVVSGVQLLPRHYCSQAVPSHADGRRCSSLIFEPMPDDNDDQMDFVAIHLLEQRDRRSQLQSLWTLQGDIQRALQEELTAFLVHLDVSLPQLNYASSNHSDIESTSVDSMTSSLKSAETSSLLIAWPRELLGLVASFVYQ